jgi:CubicO group peptidase (beta-lactamase class C family)
LRENLFRGKRQRTQRNYLPFEKENEMRLLPLLGLSGWFLLVLAPAQAEPQKSEGEAKAKAQLTDYFPPPESKGGWRSLLPETGDPNAEQKAKIRSVAGVDWDKLASAWEYNRAAEGASGLLVIRRGHVVGEWYKDCNREKTFNIYSCSKSYTSVAFGLLLAESQARKLPNGKKLTLDTKVCTEEWLPEALPLPDPRKADITLRHLLNMASGIGPEEPYSFATFEWALGKIDGSPWSKLKGEPGTVWHYSNAGVCHLVMIFNHAAGQDLFPFLKARVFEPVGMEAITWHPLGGDGELGPFSQGFSGVNTTARDHARFLYLAMHRGKWGDQQIVPASYYDFAWQGTKIKPDYGAQWWVYPHHPQAPKDMVQTAGFRANNGYAVPSLDLVFVRVGLGFQYPKDFEGELIKRVLAAVEK